MTVPTFDLRRTDGLPWETIGVPPDIRVPQTGEDIKAGRDLQLEYAIELLQYDVMRDALIPWNNQEGERKSACWEEYTGYYTADITWAEAEVLIWDSALSILWLPAGRPVNSLIQLSHVEGHVFRQVRDDGSLGKHFVFGADSEGSISAMKFNNNILSKADR